MRKVFISYHHANDQWAKDALVTMNFWGDVFEDLSVNSGDIDDEYLTDEEIRVRVRDGYLRQSTVTLVLVGTETRYRKHVDWELFSSMRDSQLNPKSGIILVPLPDTGITHFTAAHGAEEKNAIYPDVTNWTSWNRGEHEDIYPHFSTRMIDNLVCPTAHISVVPWNRIVNSPDNLRREIEYAHADRMTCEYDFSTLMRRRNGPGLRR
ncbi:TIR domain-containing protein [Devosia sp. LC5]|uniref:TIR domain-containing protein n=1 Tax=Devosia sp. LC5 TaxID=1502724 RepID=UPI00054FB437